MYIHMPAYTYIYIYIYTHVPWSNKHDFLALGDGATNPKVTVNHLIALGLLDSIYIIVKHHDPTQQPLNVHAFISAGIWSALGAG